MSNQYLGIGGNEAAMYFDGTPLGTDETPSGPPPTVDNVALGMKYAEKVGQPVDTSLPSYAIPLDELPRVFMKGVSVFALGEERTLKATNTIHRYEERVYKVVGFMGRIREAINA